MILNPVVDGLFYFVVKHEGRTWPHYGRFLQIERPRLVEYTWMSEATKGAESIVTVTMEARGEETEVTLRHSGVPDDEMGRQHQEGWASVLSALAEGCAAVGFLIRLGECPEISARGGRDIVRLAGLDMENRGTLPQEEAVHEKDPE